MADDVGCGGGGRGPERADRGGHPRPGRVARAGGRGRPTPSGAAPGRGASPVAGFVHDRCSAVHPLGLASPALRALDLDAHGVSGCIPTCRWPTRSTADGPALLERSVAATAAGLGPDEAAYRAADGPAGASRPSRWSTRCSPRCRRPRRRALPALARFGSVGAWPADRLARSSLHQRRGPGPAGRPGRPLDAVAAGSRHRGLRPVPRTARPMPWAGRWPRAAPRPSPTPWSSIIVERRRRGWRSVEPVTSLDELPPARATLLDVSPAPADGGSAATASPPATAGRLTRYRYGSGVCKVDWALDGPIPWTAPRGCAGRPPCTWAGRSTR